MDERVHLIALWNEGQMTVSQLSRSFGVSRKTVYKWLARYEQAGAAGLPDSAPIAHRHPHATPEGIVAALLELRKERPSWGPKKLRARLAQLGMAVPATSTVGELLKKHGLIRPRRRRVYPPRMPSELAQTTRPNDTWCVDFKGHFALGDKSRCYPLTLTDQVSRYLLKCEAVERQDTRCVKVHFDRAFREYGLPIRIRSDNGPPFASSGVGGLSELSVWWIKLGVTPERIEPGKPQQNGRHERMHRSLGEETTRPAAPNVIAQQLAFDRFRADYNNVRPHEALGQSAPIAHYSNSLRSMPENPKSPEYPDGMKVLKVGPRGTVKPLNQTKVLLAKSLAGEPVGMLETGEGAYQIFYGNVMLATVSLRDDKVHMVRVK
jgi:transposase InsO family protein